MKKMFMLALSGILCLSMIACSSVSSTGEEESSSSNTTIESSSEEVSSEDVSEESSDEISSEESLEETSEESSEETSEDAQESESETEETSEESSEETTTEAGKEDIEKGPYLDSLYEFKVNIGKIAYRIPIAYSAMTSRNWIYEGDDTVTLKPSQYTTEEFMDRDDVILYVSFFNLGINTEEIKDSLIGQITFDRLNLIGCETEIRFPGNIIYGKSTKREIKAAYGTPTKEEKVNDKEILTYEKGDYQWVEFTIDSDTNVVTNIDMRNFVEPANYDGGKVSEEVPEEVKNYELPFSLGDNLSLPRIQLQGKIFTLPAPVSAFLEKGWKIVEKDSHQAVVAKGVGVVTLTQNGIYITSDVVNNSDNAVYIENCFMTTVYVDLDENERGMLEIPKGISVNMPSAELEKVLKDVEHEVSYDKKYAYYTIKHEGKEGNGFTIRVNRDVSKVDSIICQSIPAGY